MRLKAIILSFFFLLTGSGLKIEIATCCDVLSGVSIDFRDNGLQTSEDCCACLNGPEKSDCCHTQSISTVINPVLGLQKAMSLSIKHFASDVVWSVQKNKDLSLYLTLQPEVSDAFVQKEHPIPILIQKRVLQI